MESSVCSGWGDSSFHAVLISSVFAWINSCLAVLPCMEISHPCLPCYVSTSIHEISHKCETQHGCLVPVGSCCQVAVAIKPNCTWCGLLVVAHQHRPSLKCSTPLKTDFCCSSNASPELFRVGMVAGDLMLPIYPSHIYFVRSQERNRRTPFFSPLLHFGSVWTVKNVKCLILLATWGFSFNASSILICTAHLVYSCKSISTGAPQIDAGRCVGTIPSEASACHLPFGKRVPTPASLIRCPQ